MKTLILLLISFVALPAALALPAAQTAPERLGTVSFTVTCAPAVQTAFVRGVALLHDFWYQEAQRQFEQIAKTDPTCAMAHWGAAMSLYHQIWDRPDDGTVARGWKEMQAAQAHPAKSARERAYVAALSDFYKPGPSDYQARVEAYAAAMARLYHDNPADTDAGAFYALSLLASKAPNDDTLTLNRKAMAVLTPLSAQYPDHPGVVHYIIHACDNPAMAADGLAAANHYGEIAQSGPHAFHMPGHIYARLGLWPQDIASQLGSIAAAQHAEEHGKGVAVLGHGRRLKIGDLVEVGRRIEEVAIDGGTEPAGVAVVGGGVRCEPECPSHGRGARECLVVDGVGGRHLAELGPVVVVPIHPVGGVGGQ